MDQPKNNPGALAADQVAAGPYTDRRNGTAEEPNAAGGRAMSDRHPWLERALVPALLSGILVVAGSFAVQVSIQMGETQGQLGELRGRLDGVDRRLDAVDQRLDAMDQRLDAMDQRLDGLDQRIDSLRTEMNDRLGRIEALLLAQRGAPSDPGS